jgi:hypothetical protein
MSRRKRTRKIVVYGVVNPEDWDDGDGLTHLSIITDDYDKFEVLVDDVGQELLDYAYETVRVFGVLEIGSVGNKILRVIDFSPHDDVDADVWDEAI